MTRTSRPLVGVSLMLEEDFARAAYPLFEAGEIEILEWSFDVGWPPASVPRWADELLAFYSSNGRLLGHGVSYSALSAGTEDQQAAWLQLLQMELRTRSYRHISEHFGFSSTNFHQSAPLPVPLSADAATQARRLTQLRRLSVPVVWKIWRSRSAFATSTSGPISRSIAGAGGWFLLLDFLIFVPVGELQSNVRRNVIGYPLQRVRRLHVRWVVEQSPSPSGEGRE